MNGSLSSLFITKIKLAPTHCYGLNVFVLLSSHIEATIPSVALLSDGDSKKVIGIKWSHKGGAPFNKICALIRDTRELLFFSIVWQRIQEEGRWSSPESDPAGLWSGTSRIHNCEKANFCCLNHLVFYSILFYGIWYLVYDIFNDNLSRITHTYFIIHKNPVKALEFYFIYI